MDLIAPLRPMTLSLIFVAAASSCGSQFESETPGPPAGTVPVGLQDIATGVSFPLYLTSPPGDTDRLFILERAGAIRIVKAGVLLPTPFLSLVGQVSTDGERGLLGLAFDPDYATTGQFVVHYTDLTGNTRVTRFRVSSDPDVADPASEEVLLTAEQPFSNHKGGQIAFGPDGLLYIGLGDGGGADDPNGRGQSLADLLGSILRIDSGGDLASTVPADNPFVAVAGARPVIWS
jgi:glucose/arabinose dehydrogenase